MNQEREDVSMIEGELPVQPTQPSMAIQKPAELEEGKSTRTATNARSSKTNEVPETPAELAD
jgi:hypothetical protein